MHFVEQCTENMKNIKTAVHSSCKMTKDCFHFVLIWLLRLIHEN